MPFSLLFRPTPDSLSLGGEFNECVSGVSGRAANNNVPECLIFFLRRSKWFDQFNNRVIAPALRQQATFWWSTCLFCLVKVTMRVTHVSRSRLLADEMPHMGSPS
jgi:hypothetical protein